MYRHSVVAAARVTTRDRTRLVGRFGPTTRTELALIWTFATPTVAPPVTPTTRFGGAPVSIRETDQQVSDERLARLLREDEEILCLI